MTARKNGIGTPDRPPVTQRPPKKEPTFGKRRNPLKKSRKPRPMSPAQMDTLVQSVMLRDGRCVACDFDTAMCDGRTQAHHLVPQRELRAHYEGKQLTQLLADTRNAVALCETHHGLVERGFLHLPDEVLPLGFGAFLRETGFEAWWDSMVGRRVA